MAALFKSKTCWSDLFFKLSHLIEWNFPYLWNFSLLLDNIFSRWIHELNICHFLSPICFQAQHSSETEINEGWLCCESLKFKFFFLGSFCLPRELTLMLGGQTDVSRVRFHLEVLHPWWPGHKGQIFAFSDPHTHKQRSRRALLPLKTAFQIEFKTIYMSMGGILKTGSSFSGNLPPKKIRRVNLAHIT